MDETLVATLGTEPQVVTLVLDELLRRGHIVRRTIVVHTDDSIEPVKTAVFKLKAEAGRYYSYLSPPVRFGFEPIEGDRGRPQDILTEEDAGAAFKTLYRIVLREKRAGYRIHLSIAGGRKAMAVYGMAVAQLLFDEEDRVWHVVSEEVLHSRERLHAEPDERVVLVPIPVLKWSTISPVMTELVVFEDPWRAMSKQREMRELRDRISLLHFVEHELSPMEREILKLLVGEGLSNKELACRICR
ncbi:MAG TPA: hypothetical protein EYP61_04250, partial [Candidatus Latescibacteria bacterium]|nr:hypothetical protein [Candidatus Latescibacterota bacterium]